MLLVNLRQASEERLESATIIAPRCVHLLDIRRHLVVISMLVHHSEPNLYFYLYCLYLIVLMQYGLCKKMHILIPHILDTPLKFGEITQHYTSTINFLYGSYLLT